MVNSVKHPLSILRFFKQKTHFCGSKIYVPDYENLIDNTLYILFGHSTHYMVALRRQSHQPNGHNGRVLLDHLFNATTRF